MNNIILSPELGRSWLLLTGSVIAIDIGIIWTVFTLMAYCLVKEDRVGVLEIPLYLRGFGDINPFKFVHKRKPTANIESNLNEYQHRLAAEANSDGFEGDGR